LRNVRFGSRPEEILSFAGQFDPQPIHVDPEYAVDGPFGGLIASGWHTASLFMRMFTDHYLSKVASVASVAEARVSRSKPDRGLVRTDIAVLNQDDVTVLTMSAVNILRRRSVLS
jgi:acyl dehydratase